MTSRRSANQQTFQVGYRPEEFQAGLRGEHERVASNMVALPRLTDDEMVAAYNECDALLFPSRMEGFGYPVAEAMACGKPVVCSNSSSMPELVEHGRGGRLCPVDDVRAFADAVRDLAGTTPSERARMGAFNRQRVLDSFTNERSVQQYEALYRKLLGEG